MSLKKQKTVLLSLLVENWFRETKFKSTILPSEVVNLILRFYLCVLGNFVTHVGWQLKNMGYKVKLEKNERKAAAEYI